MSIPIRATPWIQGVVTTSSRMTASSATRCLGAEFGAVAGSFDDELGAAALARRSSALLPRIGLSNSPSHSSTPRFEVKAKLA